MVSLVFTTIAPSIANANELSVQSIKIETGSDTRTINSASGVITQESSTGGVETWDENSIEVYYDFTTQSMTFSKGALDISKNYRFTWVVNYSEGEEEYYYFNENNLTGSDLLLMERFTLPTTENLKETTFENDVQDFNQHHFEFKTLETSNYDSATILSYGNPFSKHLVVNKDADFFINFSLIGSDIPQSEATGPYPNHFINSSIDFNKTVNSLSEYKSELSNINIETSSEYATFYYGDKYSGYSLGKNSYVSNGDYRVHYGQDVQWEGNVSIQASQTLTLPDSPSEVNVQMAYSNTSGTSLELGYEIIATNGTFEINYSSHPISTRLLQGTEVISSWDSTVNYNFHSIEMDKNPSGIYTLEVTSDIGGTPVTSQAEVKYTSSWQDLKGTVITAENSAGELLVNAQATLYELTNYQGYQKVVTEESKATSNNEIFIPDAYILTGQEYLLVVESDVDKVAYVNKFIGQSTNTIHLESSSLHSFNLNTNNLLTTKTSVQLVDPANENVYVPSSYLNKDWKVSTDLDVVLFWSGQSEDFKIGYEWSGLADFVNGNDLTSVEWYSHKPSSIYLDASLYVHAQSVEKYDEIKSNYYQTYSRPSVILEVVDNETTYKGPIYHHEISEIKFGDYNGLVKKYDQSSNSLNTTYVSDFGFNLDINSTSAMSFTYDILNAAGETVESEIETTDMYNLALPSTLTSGEYTLVLKSSSINSSIVNLIMNAPFTVDSSIQKDISIPANPVTPYGPISSNDWDTRFSIKQQENFWYRNIAEFKYNKETTSFELSYMNSSIDPAMEYMIFASTTVEGVPIYQSEIMTGQDILNFTQDNPFNFSNDLVKVSVDLTNIDTVSNFVELRLERSISNLFKPLYLYQGPSDKMEAYISKGNYYGSFIMRDDISRKIVDIPEINFLSDQMIPVNTTDLAKIEFTQGDKKLPIFGYIINDNTHYQNQYDEFITAHYMSKKSYDKFSFAVATSDLNDTPWGYRLTKDNVVLSQDEQYNFTGDITGVINSIEVYGNEYIEADIKLTSNEFAVDGIYNAVKNQYTFLNVDSTDETPIREYYGLFNDMNNVSITMTIKDELGTTVVSQTNKPFFLDYVYIELDQELKAGKYTAYFNIPTGPKKSLTLTKEFTIGGEPAPFVTIDTPVDGYATKDASVEVTGSATANAELVVTLKKDTATVDTKTVTASAEGDYSVTFSPQAEGTYTVEVANGEVTDTSTFTIDRTAPVKATDIAFVESANGLTVSWTGATDAAQYKVEVAEGTGEFTTVQATQTASTYTIANVKPGTTYQVRITSYDAVGNESTSEVASFDVATFVTTAITIEDKRNNNDLLVIGDALKVTLEGSYEEGFVGEASVSIDGEANEVTLTYNSTTQKYEGTLEITAGMKNVDSISGFILNGSEKTNEKVLELDWLIGSTITGSVTDGDPVVDATIRYSNDTAAYSVKSDASGNYSLKGIKAGTYSVEVTFGTRTYSQAPVTLNASEEKEVAAFTLPALTNPIFNFVDSIAKESIGNVELPVRIEGPNNFTAYGSTKAGKFVAYGGKTLTNLVTGNYTVTVFGEGIFETTTSEVTLTKASDYTVEVTKANVEMKDITITLPEGVDIVDSISLYSSSITEKFNYSRYGSYYEFNVEPINNTITLQDVVLADDYVLNVAAEGYISYNQSVNLKDTQSITVELELGREISGKVTDSQGAVGLVHVYAYAGETYYSTQTDGEGKYTLKGLSKEDDVTVGIYSQIHLNKQVTITKGTEKTTQNIELSKAASLTGKVVDKDGNPMANVSVSATGENSYGWARTAKDGSFSVNGLVDTQEYDLELSSYGYPTLTVENQKIGESIEYTLQKQGDGNFNGEGNFFAASKSSVVPGDKVQFTLVYQNNGTITSSDVPVTLSIPVGLTLIPETVQLNGKVVTASENVVTIPSIEAGKSGKLTFEATVKGDISEPSLTVTAKVTDTGTVLSASTSVVFVTLEAPAQTGTSTVKVYGTAKYGSTIEIYANNKLVGQTKVESKWWYSDIKLPVTDTAVEEKFIITAKATSGSAVVNSKPVTVSYTPNVPTLTDVTVHAGWNGDVNLNPYTGVATFAIVEHTPLDTEIKFDQDVDSASISFLGETYELTKGSDHTFTFDGSKLGKWTSYGEQLLEVTFKKGDVEITMPLMNIIVLIDPSGFVFEDSMDNKLEGVQAIVETQDANGNWIKWDAAKFGQINPQVTDAEGRYGWDVITGKWRVIFTKDGYEPYISRIMDVPPPETELNVPMVKIGDPSILTTDVTEKDLSVTFDRYMNVENKNDNITLYEVKDGERIAVEGSITTEDKAGYKSIATPSDKLTGFVGQDSNEEDGFFEVDPSTTVSKTFTFVPKTPLKSDTDYVLVINENVKDTESRILGATSELTFTTESAPTTSPSPGTGGGTFPPPSTTSPELGEVIVDPTTGAQLVMVNKNSMEEIIAKATKSVNLDVSKLDVSKAIQLSIPSTVAAKLDAKVKHITITTANATVEIPVNVFKELSGKGDTVTFSIKPVAKSELVKGTTHSPIHDLTLGFNKDGKAALVSSFKEDIQVTFNLTTTSKDNRKTAVFYLDEKNKKLVYVGGKVKDGKITFNASHFSSYVAIESTKTFKDLPSWSKDYIEVLASRGIVKGKSESSYGSGDSIKRGEFAVLIARAFALETTDYKGTFKDVPASMTWGAKEIEAANRAGIINGFSSTEFKPNEIIKRQEMAAMIIRALKLKNPSIGNEDSNLPAFKDAKDISAYAKADVQLAYILGIISGYEVANGSEFRPHEHATRAQAAKMLYLMLEEGNEF